MISSRILLVMVACTLVACRLKDDPSLPKKIEGAKPVKEYEISGTALRSVWFRSAWFPFTHWNPPPVDPDIMKLSDGLDGFDTRPELCGPPLYLKKFDTSKKFTLSISSGGVSIANVAGGAITGIEVNRARTPYGNLMVEIAGANGKDAKGVNGPTRGEDCWQSTLPILITGVGDKGKGTVSIERNGRMKWKGCTSTEAVIGLNEAFRVMVEQMYEINRERN